MRREKWLKTRVACAWLDQTIGGAGPDAGDGN